LRVAKAIVDLPLIAEAMKQGDLSFSAGRELTRVATADTEGEWLEAANDKNLRQVEELVAGHDRGAKPSDPKDPSLRKHKFRFDDLDGETVALIRQARQILEREQGERLTDNALLRLFGRMIIDGAASPERTTAPYQIAVTVCTECKRGWQHGGGITVEMSPPALEMALCDAHHIGSIDHDDEEALPSRGASRNRANDKRGTGASRPRVSGAGRPRTKAARARSDIPRALRRRVKHRDHYKCRVPWCRSSINVDCHHIRPVSAGGTHTFDNLISLCESHHLAHHEGALIIEGTATSPAFRRREHHALATVERAIDTKRALESLGFDKNEVNAAMAKTKTHVGTAELALEQWIKIALTYCPKPR
jgi:hypothetical protein